MWNLIKPALPILAHRVVLMALSFIAAKFVFAHGVAEQLMRGDTIPLYGTQLNISTADIENWLLVVLVPLIISTAIALWGRLKAQYMLFIARNTLKRVSVDEVKEVVADTPTAVIIKTVKEQTS